MDRSSSSEAKKKFWLNHLERPVTAVLDPEQHPVGHQFTYKGQVYEVAEWKPYCKRDGTASFIVTVRSACAECDAPFTVTYSRKLSWLNRRCSVCARPGVLVAQTRKRPRGRRRP